MSSTTPSGRTQGGEAGQHDASPRKKETDTVQPVVELDAVAPCTGEPVTGRDPGDSSPCEPTSPPATEQASKSHARWWAACALGIAVTTPLAWLLSYAATLPFFIGLFFFVLFGLIIGAVIHRVAAPGRPYARSVLATGTAIVVLFGWSFSLIIESRDFPTERARYVSDKTRDLGGRGVDEFRETVAGQLREYLREHYPPGGTIGYMRWALTSGEIPKGEVKDVRMKLGQTQWRYAWAIRVVLSLPLFIFGVGSQTWALRLENDPIVRAMDRV